MKICVFGAGAVGGHVAAKLAAGGHDVSVIARGAHLEAMRDKGITLIQGEQDDPRPRARGGGRIEPRIAGFCLRHAEGQRARRFRRRGRAARRPARPAWCSARTAFRGGTASVYRRSARRPPDLSKLDPRGRLQKLLKPEQIIGGVVYSANEVREPGVIVNNNLPGNNMIVVGRADDAAPPDRAELRAMLEAERHLTRRSTADIRTVGVGQDRPGARHRRAVHAHRRGDRRGARQPGAVEARGEARRRSARHRARARRRSRARAESPERRPVLRPDRPQAVDAAGLRARPADGSRGAARRRRSPSRAWQMSQCRRWKPSSRSSRSRPPPRGCTRIRITAG